MDKWPSCQDEIFHFKGTKKGCYQIKTIFYMTSVLNIFGRLVNFLLKFARKGWKRRSGPLKLKIVTSEMSDCIFLGSNQVPDKAFVVFQHYIYCKESNFSENLNFQFLPFQALSDSPKCEKVIRICFCLNLSLWTENSPWVLDKVSGDMTVLATSKINLKFR